MRRLPQPGHTKPSGQRRLNKKAAQLSSSENDFWNSASDRALAISVRPAIRPITSLRYYIWGHLSQRDKRRIQYRITNVGEVLPAGGKVFTMLDISYVYMDVYLPTAEA